MQYGAYKHTKFIPVLVIIGNHVTLVRYTFFLIHTNCGISGRIPLLNEKQLRHFGR